MRLLLISTLSVSSLLAESLAPSCPTFGTLAPATFGGTAIPNTSVCQTSFNDGAATITIGLTATPRPPNTSVTDNGAGTYTAPVGVGQVSPYRGLWNFSFYVNVANNTAGNTYQFDLFYDTDPSNTNAFGTLGNISSPLASYPGVVVGVNSLLLQDFYNLGFGFLNGGVTPGVTLPAPNLGYDADAVGLYTFSLQLTNIANPLATGGVSIQVQADTPEPSTYALVGIGLAAVVARSRRRAVNQ